MSFNFSIMFIFIGEELHMGKRTPQPMLISDKVDNDINETEGKREEGEKEEL